MASRLLVLLLALLSPFSASARDCGAEAILTNQSPVSAYDLIRPEVEAKGRPANKHMFKKMFELDGKTYTLKGPDGRNYTYVFYLAPRLQYIDTFYDIINGRGKAVLLEKQNLLRRRERYRWDKKEKDWEFERVVFHAKNEALRGNEVLDSLTVRNEIRGKPSKNRAKFLRRTPDMLEEATDEAIAYARSLAGPSGQFEEVMQAIQDRQFFHAYPLVRRGDMPSFTLSLDEIEYEGLRDLTRLGRKPSEMRAEELGVELELTYDDEATKSLVRKHERMLWDLFAQLASDYNLSPVSMTKYQSGARMTILRR